MVSDARAWGWLIALSLIAAEPVVAQSSGPSTTGGALPYIVGPAKPAEPPAAKAPEAGETRPATGVRVIDLSKRDPERTGERPAAPPAATATTPTTPPAPPAAAPATPAPTVASPTAPAPAAPVVANPAPTTPAVPAPTAETAKPVITPPPPAGANEIAATPPAVDGASPTVGAPRPVADVAKPKAKPKARVATTKPPPAKRPPAATARIERFDHDVEVEIETPRRPRGGRLAGYDAWGRPIYFMPGTPGRDRRVARGPIEVEEDWIEPPARLRPLPPLGVLRPFPPRGQPGSFRNDACRVIFFTDEYGRTHREVACR
jgi:hypothetical protein